MNVIYLQTNLMGSLNIYAAATRNVDEGLPIISSYINTLHCKDSWSNEMCKAGLKNFRSSVSYLRLKGKTDYIHLQSVLNATRETLRIFYMSVSPSLYEDLASSINQYARSTSELRVVFEKPFGNVSPSCNLLAIFNSLAKPSVCCYIRILRRPLLCQKNSLLICKKMKFSG